MQIPQLQSANETLRNIANIAEDKLDEMIPQLEHFQLGLSKAARDYSFEMEMWERLIKAFLIGGAVGLRDALHNVGVQQSVADRMVEFAEGFDFDSSEMDLEMQDGFEMELN